MNGKTLWTEIRTWAAGARRPERRKPKTTPTIGLALGGGFARGLAHLGVLKVLEENRIPVHAIAGTSAGSIVGGAYAGGASVAQLIECTHPLRFKDFAGWTLSRLGLASNERMEQFVTRLFPKKTFEELRIPLAVVATDLLTGEAVVFRRGSLLTPVRASCAYPGLFLPIQFGGRTLIDGAFACPVPIMALKQMGVSHIIAVDLGQMPSTMPTNIFQVINHCFSILQHRAGPECRKGAHVVIEPNVRGFAWDDFGRASDLIAMGEAAARAALPRIKSWFDEGERQPAFGPVLPALQPIPTERT